MEFKPWQLWGLVPAILGGMFFYSSINPPKQAEAVTAVAPSRIPLTPQELIEQRRKDGSDSKAGVPKATPGVTLTTLYRFKGIDGSVPDGLNYVDNTFYGTTQTGGTFKKGTVFKLTPARHELTTLHYFNGVDGSNPSERLVVDVDRNLYGKTIFGGPNNAGTIFKIAATGIFTSLYNLNGKGEGGRPYGKLIRNSGYLWGTNVLGGKNNRGTIFKLSPGGNWTVLYHFSGKDGANPVSGLIRDLAGNFYGTTDAGGTSRSGTIFKLTSDGTLTTLYSFNRSNGAIPSTDLIRDLEGNLFGATRIGGEKNRGTIFKLALDGSLSILHSFKRTDGALPYKGLIRDSVGNLFGTTYLGGANDYGTVFQIAPDGTFTLLYSFSGLSDGRYPVQLRLFKGALYGVTNRGGIFSEVCGIDGCGTIFKLSISPSAPVRKHSPQPMLQSPPGNPNE